MSIFSVSRSIRSSRRAWLLAAGVGIAALAWAQIGLAQSGGPFGAFAGGWRGSGLVVGADGNHERITCRARYLISESGRALSESLVCASDSYRVDVDSYVIADGHSVEGHWQETTRQGQGNLTGQIVDGDLEGGVVGPGFTAEISLRATGRRQIMSIKPQGGDVNHVTVVLSPEN